MRRRHGIWAKSRLMCSGEAPKAWQYRPCPFSAMLDIPHLPFTVFASCPRSLANNRQTRMLASLRDLGCYSNLEEWTRPIHAYSTLASLTPIQVDLLASAVQNLATSFVTFGLVEHIVYTQYMYRMHFGLIFRNPFTDTTSESQTRKAYEQSTLLPRDYVSTVMARNRIDELFVDAARHIFASRLTMRLRSESVLPRPEYLLSDGDLEVKICGHLRDFMKTEVRRNLAMKMN